MNALISDITRLSVDAIVNAANATLLGGGGVDGAIHRAAGPDMLKECRTLGGCSTGEARITRGYKLPAKYVIHAVGPVWNGGASDEAELLRECYLSSLTLAQEHGCRSVAFPCISTGAYRYPPQKAAPIAVQACRDYLRDNNYDCAITFCCFSKEDVDIYQKVLKEGV